MSDLFKEMCSLSGKLSDFLDDIKEKEDSENLLTIFFKVNELCEKLAYKEFDENDDFYVNTIIQITVTGGVIKKFKENQIKLTEVFDHLKLIIDNVLNIREIENER